MDDANPLNSTHDVGLFKKILLYLNVSAFRLVKMIPTVSNYRNNYNARGASVAIIVLSEFAIAKLFFPVVPTYRYETIVFGFFFHFLIDIFFIKDIIIMAGNYNAYYNRLFFYLFIAVFITAVVVSLITLNNQIGHLPADYNQHRHKHFF